MQDVRGGIHIGVADVATTGAVENGLAPARRGVDDATLGAGVRQISRGNSDEASIGAFGLVLQLVVEPALALVQDGAAQSGLRRDVPPRLLQRSRHDLVVLPIRRSSTAMKS